MEVNWALYNNLKEYMDRKGLLNLSPEGYEKAIRELLEILQL